MSATPLHTNTPASFREKGMVGDPGIEPGMGLPGGVTVRCRTLQHVARRDAVDNRGGLGRQLQISVASGTWQGCGQGVTGPCKAAWG